MTPVSRKVYGAAVGTGVAYANLAVALPLYVLAAGHSPAFAGGILAAQAGSIAIGALAAGPISLRFGAWNTLAAGLLVIAVGASALLAARPDATLVPGALLHGVGMGLFWVGTQALLASRSGRGGSERAFVVQYSLYVVGTALGAAATGFAVFALRLAGVPHELSIRLTFLLALVAASAAAAGARHTRDAVAAAPARRRPSPLEGLSIQVPDLLLVSALALVLNLAPIVLVTAFRFTPLQVGLVVGALAGAKIAGSFTAGRIVRSASARRAVIGMLATAAPLTLVLAAMHAAVPFVAVLLCTTLLSSGTWPVLVDAAHARVPVAGRTELASAWNVREYLVIAGMTAAGGWLLAVVGGPGVLLMVAACLLAASAATAAAVLRRPVHVVQQA